MYTNNDYTRAPAKAVFASGGCCATTIVTHNVFSELLLQLRAATPSQATRRSDAENFPPSAVCIRLMIDAGLSMRDSVTQFGVWRTVFTLISCRWAGHADASNFLGSLRVSDGPQLETTMT